MNILCLILLTTLLACSNAFAPSLCGSKVVTQLQMAVGEDAAAPLVSGADLEMMLTEWDQPLVVDAYATWCGPCVLMAPEFEAAAQELKGKVRFVKIDTDKDEAMAARLNIMGLPTLLFLDKFTGDEGKDEESEAKAVLKGRLEGAIRKEQIIEFCEHYFFDGPEPKLG
eukprot:CAMPEP_0113635172 /NCGR_PEP_ID=MMETSP0017_2-20120614/18328_1 /TAXON_ID=2856 /ORGANISM="Cylindrotheca closterium" /LENGTH=168 /DNA_ID=CAMNT_0000545929 /DNA_START=81 /DNA_END=587 /DNA_ORIENTATION=- /assembly_acc=CAM_ASM_000147